MELLYPALPVAGVLAWFGPFANHALKMRVEKNFREMWGSAFLSLVPAAIFLIIVATGSTSMESRNLLLMPSGAILGAALFAYLGYVIADFRAARAQSDIRVITEAQLSPNERGPIINQNVTSNNQQGGITAHTVNVGPQPRDLDSSWGGPLKTQMLSSLPRDKDLTIMALMGDSEGISLALQIHSFLKSNGFKMKEDGISQGVFSGVTRGLNFNSETNTFIVGGR